MWGVVVMLTQQLLRILLSSFFFFFKVQAQRNSLLVQETSRYQSISSFSGWIEDDIKSILGVVLSYSN